jgi:glycosyltransferase involved in cell wall biosynthesis
MKIAIVVHGRFHAFDLARALINRGHDVTLFTNYPAWAVERFGIARKHVHSFLFHGIVTRIALRLRRINSGLYPESWLHRLFGRWAAIQLRRQKWDVIHYWSGIGEELLQKPAESGTLRVMMRGSSHIRVQSRLLEEEEQRTGTQLERPSPWMIGREEREYALAEKISVLSTFAYQSFIAEGIAEDKLCILPLGTQHSDFRPASEVIEQRCRRILSGKPLRILYAGSLSFRKGFLDMLCMLKAFTAKQFDFRIIGPVADEVASYLSDLQVLAEIIPKQAQSELGHWYQQSDLFLFPSIEDGFAVVLSQAQAGGLPILTTTNCAGPDIVIEGSTGWVLPIRDPAAFIERLHWCDAHRVELAAMVQRIYNEYRPRDWNDVAADFERLCSEALGRVPSSA